jgi:UDP-N-acetylmuramate--alanine ligase
MNTNEAKKIFFSGIAGSGVSAIAGFMADKGNIIAGSDRAFDLDPDNPLKKIFQSKGISIVPQDGIGIDRSFDFAVFSTAVEDGKPEVIKARELGIRTKTRPEYLAEITASFKTIAVSGTSGKSTSSGLLAFLMNRLGLEPNFIGGGRVKQFKSDNHPGNSLTGKSDSLIIEACESDGSIIYFRPQHTIILNLSFDHHSIGETADMFKQLAEHTQNRIIINGDDRNLNGISEKDAATFSIYNASDYRAEQITMHPLYSEFTICKTRFSLSLPGEHNIYNALSCISFLSEIGIPIIDIASVLPEFNGIDRRFDIHVHEGETFVIDDYAHNPHKIQYMMKTVQQLSNKICFIFQPHGFGPTKMMKKEYIETFVSNLRDSDHLVLLPIYYVGGTAGKDISSENIADEIMAQKKSAEVIQNRDDISNMVKDFRSFIIFGARDETLSNFAEKLAGVIKKQQN